MGTRPSQDGAWGIRALYLHTTPGATLCHKGPWEPPVWGPSNYTPLEKTVPTPNVCARLLDPFAPLNSILSLFFNHSLPSLHIKEFVYLLNQQKPWRLTVPWWGTCPPSAFPHGSSALQHHICLASQEHREPKERPQRFSEGNGVLSGRCAFRIRQTGRGTWGVCEQLQENHEHAREACTPGKANSHHTSTVAVDTSLRT